MAQVLLQCLAEERAEIAGGQGGGFFNMESFSDYGLWMRCDWPWKFFNCQQIKCVRSIRAGGEPGWGSPNDAFPSS